MTSRPVHFALPASGPGQRIGLFGGSFNPPHEGHRLVALEALKRLDLDAVWILVSPGNPLKDHKELAPLDERVRATKALMDHPKLRVTGFEAVRGFHYTWQTLSFLKDTLPDRRFVWIMGTDSFRDFHRWQRWREIANLFPMAIYARPGTVLRAPASRAGTALARFRVEETDAGKLAHCRPPAWVFLSGLMSGLSSTDIRASRRSG